MTVGQIFYSGDGVDALQASLTEIQDTRASRDHCASVISFSSNLCP